MKKLVVLLMMSVLLTVYSQAQYYEKQYEYGDTVRATVHPDPGWELVGWYHGEELLGTDYTLEYVVTSDMLIRVVLRKIVVTIRVVVDPPNAGTVTGAGDYDPGDEVLLHVEPRPGYRFDKLQKQSGYEVPNPYQFTAEKDAIFHASLIKDSPDLVWWLLIGSAVAGLLLVIINVIKKFKKQENELI